MSSWRFQKREERTTQAVKQSIQNKDAREAARRHSGAGTPGAEAERRPKGKLASVVTKNER